MKRTYKINNIFDSDGKYLDDVIRNFLLAFLDKEFNNYENSDDIISNL